MHSDERGLALTTESAAAAEHFNASVNQYLEYRSAAMGTLKQALEEDPAFVMGHCLRGYLFMLFSSNSVLGKVEQSLQAAEAGLGHVTWREKAHVGALSAWSAGDMAKSNAIWEEILVEHPLDVLALRLQHFNAFWMGRSQLLRDAVAGVFGAWDDGIPGYGSVLGMYAFGLEECGDYGRAEELGRRAVDLNGDDLWAVHAVAHVLEMQGRAEEGAAWLSRPADIWDDRNPFKGHLWWHAAMFALALGDYDRVLALYDRSVVPEPSDFYLDVQNAASMLARLDILGVDVGDRWKDLADMVESRLGDHTLAFTEMHYMMALVRDGRIETAERLLESLRRFAKTPDNFSAATMIPVAVPLCEAILAYGRGTYDKAIELMLPIRDDYARVGGSHAQRDIFAQFLIEAAIKGGRPKLARALLSERVGLYPRSRAAWTRYAETLDGLGDGKEADTARQRAADLAAA